ncbi:hypothetical protein WJX81_002510 [Elliptochloris bilobata]|uniref:Uncharacterized protein n=1 Tax=Elliptochloris bilobata TaxID=381761 RepID=A0AAW1QXJ2_9CHLO
MALARIAVLALVALVAASCLSQPAAARTLAQYSVNHDGGVVTPGQLQPGELSSASVVALWNVASLTDHHVPTQPPAPVPTSPPISSRFPARTTLRMRER